VSAKWKAIFDTILQDVLALGYRPSLRWCFYRALERFGLSKDDYKNFKNNIARIRKGRRFGWAPDTLEDATRRVFLAGHGPTDKSGFFRALIENACSAGIWGRLPFYTEVWFEANAMVGQFEKYVRRPYRISLRPFGGDYTIAPKWEAAQQIKAMAENGKRVVILYFGDADTKGGQIPLSAYKDVRSWAGVDFDFHIGGLTREQAELLRLPENPERPGQYQWEALTDTQAKEIIESTLRSHLNLPKVVRAGNDAAKKSSRWVAEAASRLGVKWVGNHRP
jgi:hypothetical protein